MPRIFRIVRISTLAAAASALVSATLAAQAPARAATVARIDSIMNAALAAPFSGFQVAVVKGRDTLLMKAYGMANIEHAVPVTSNTIFRIGSLTKQFTSAAIMGLVEQGKLSLDDPLSQYMPNVPAHWRPITIRQLLNHTSGIPSYTDVGPRMRTVFATGTPRDTMLAMLRNDSLMFTPGTGFYYNNTGYYILGMLIEQLGGKPFGIYLADNLLKPLGLQRTMYCGTTEIIRDRASGYDRQGASLVNTSYIDMDVPYAAGSMCSTARELVTWAHALASGKLVQAASYKSMSTPVKLPSVRPMTYGFGLMADTIGSHRVVNHGGNIPGFAAELIHLPDDSLFVAVLSNTSSAPSGRIAQDIARAVVGVPRVVIAQRDEPVSAEERAAMVGRYSLAQPDGTRREVTVAEQDGKLVITLPGQPPVQFLRQNGPVFSVRGQPTARVLFEATGGRVTGLVLDRGVRPLPALRIP
jgi:D-alanyl-D-alanine carboxypeptidase